MKSVKSVEYDADTRFGKNDSFKAFLKEIPQDSGSEIRRRSDANSHSLGKQKSNQELNIQIQKRNSVDVQVTSSPLKKNQSMGPVRQQ